MLMQSARSAPSAAAAACATGVSGLNATPAPSPSSRARAIVRAGSVATSAWNVTLSPPAFLDALEVLLRLGDHQVAVEPPAALVDEPGDRREHDRADRDLADEVPVADVEVEDAHARVEQRVELRAETREVGSVDRGLDLGPSYPVGPRHGRTVPG